MENKKIPVWLFKVKLFCQLHNINQRQLSAELSIHKGTIQKWNEGVNVNRNNMRKLTKLTKGYIEENDINKTVTIGDILTNNNY